MSAIKSRRTMKGLWYESHSPDLINLVALNGAP